MRTRCEIAIIGGGFGGTLLAMILKAQGRDVVVLERQRHPRFTIGESSTPLANLVLDALCGRYGLDELRPLTKYGSWKREHPDIGCGPKRGFSFVAHEPGAPFEAFDDHRNELLVAASPSQEVADTQWMRSDVDAFFARTAQARGVTLMEGAEVTRVSRGMATGPGGPRWTLRVSTTEDSARVDADFVVDASGGSGPLAGAVPIGDRTDSLRTRSHAVYGHFEGVRRWQDVFEELGGESADHPHPVDEAALHHITQDGWVWLIRFDGGVTSVGMVLRGHPGDRSSDSEWKEMLTRYPSIGAQLGGARPTRPLVRTGRLQRRVACASGSDWALLPAAAYFVDPLLSAGNAHTLYGIERLGAAFEDWPDRARMEPAFRRYDAQLQDEIDLIDDLVSGCNAAANVFPLFAAHTMYYFAGAHFTETRRREDGIDSREGFLHAHDSSFRGCVRSACTELDRIVSAQRVDPADIARYEERVRRDIEPYNLIGLCDPARLNLYPFV